MKRAARKLLFLFRPRRLYVPDELWASRPELRPLNDGFGSCNTGARAAGVCNLGGIGCDVNHIEVARINGLTTQRTARTAE